MLHFNKRWKEGWNDQEYERDSDRDRDRDAGMGSTHPAREELGKNN